VFRARSCWAMAEQVAGLNTGDRTLVGYRELGHATSFKPLYPKRPKALVGLE